MSQGLQRRLPKAPQPVKINGIHVRAIEISSDQKRTNGKIALEEPKCRRPVYRKEAVLWPCIDLPLLSMLLLLGTIYGGGASLGLFPSGSRSPRREGYREKRKPRSVAFPDGAAEHSAPHAVSMRPIVDRDSRLSVLDRESFSASYGGLEIRRLKPGEGFDTGRVIGPPDPNDAKADGIMPPGHETFVQLDEWFGAYDDDSIRTKVYQMKSKETKRCRRTAWHKLHRPTCNEFHSLDITNRAMRNHVLYLGRGHFRQAFQLSGQNIDTNITLKVMRWRSGSGQFDEVRFEKTRVDAVVMERLSSSPRITDIFGHCATSVAVESLPGDVEKTVVPTAEVIKKEDLHDVDGVDNKNGMKPLEKLQLALNMSEAIADLHGFRDGAIVHDDLDLGQFLRAPDGTVKLNDFNRAKPMLWDNMVEKYCKYFNGDMGSKMISPEEISGTRVLDEQMDVYSLGNAFYGILTGLWPFPFDTDKVAHRKMIDGERPYIDERWRNHSFAERKLIEAMEKMWIHDPNQRIDIFGVVTLLRQAVAEHANLEKGESA